MPERISQEDLAEALCRPAGTLEFRYTSDVLFELNATGVLFEKVAGQHYFRLERFPRQELRFFHSSPGLGTRVAVINLARIRKTNAVDVALVWSPEHLGLFVRPHGQDEQGEWGEGAPSDIQFRITTEGQVVQIGGPGIEVSGMRFTMGGKQQLEPTAIEAWHETLRAIEILWKASSTEGFMYECVRTNLTISMLVTGLETYSKRRFAELEQEGVIPDIDSLIGSLYTKRVNDYGLQTVRGELQDEATEKERTLLSQIAQQVNFQNIEQCKKAYRKAYGLQFAQIPKVQSQTESLRRLMRFRHRIVHVSPLLPTLETPGDAYGSKETVFANEATGIAAKTTFSEFIEGLHAATLSLPA